MATNRRKICVNWFNKTLQVSERDASSWRWFTFHQYETIPLEVFFVEPDVTIYHRFARLSVAPLSLTISMHSSIDTATPFVQQATWTKDTSRNVLIGDLDLNTASFNSWLSTSPKTAYIELDITDAASRWRSYWAVTCSKSLTKLTTSSPDPAQEYFTKAQSDGRYLQPILTAGQTVTYTSPSGTWQRIIGVDDNGQPIDQILQV